MTAAMLSKARGGRTVQKTPASRSMIAAALSGQHFSSSLNTEDVVGIVDAMSALRVAAGGVIVKQGVSCRVHAPPHTPIRHAHAVPFHHHHTVAGEVFDAFFVVETGSLSVSTDAKHVSSAVLPHSLTLRKCLQCVTMVQQVATLNAGNTFGDLALLHARRSDTTIRATTPALLWRLPAASFRRVVESCVPQKLALLRKAIQKVVVCVTIPAAALAGARCNNKRGMTPLPPCCIVALRSPCWLVLRRLSCQSSAMPPTRRSLLVVTSLHARETGFKRATLFVKAWSSVRTLGQVWSGSALACVCVLCRRAYARPSLPSTLPALAPPCPFTRHPRHGFHHARTW